MGLLTGMLQRSKRRPARAPAVVHCSIRRAGDCDALGWPNAVVAVLALAGVACGTLGSEDTAPTNLPASGAGPYRALPLGTEVLLQDHGASLDDAQLLVDGERLTVFYTRRDSAGVSLRRARFASLDDRVPEIDSDLGSDEVHGSIGRDASQPALLPPARTGEPWLLCFARAGRIECAVSDDGDRFVARPDLTLAPVAAVEGATLGSPALLRLHEDGAPGGRRARLLYLAGEASADAPRRLFAADAALPAGSGGFVRIDGNPDTPARDPVLAPGAAPWLQALGRTTARTVTTPAGRPRYDLFLSGVSGSPPARVVGFASSYDGLRFAVAAAPFLDPHLPEEWAPTAAAWRDGTLLLFSKPDGDRSVIAAAVGP